MTANSVLRDRPSPIGQSPNLAKPMSMDWLSRVRQRPDAESQAYDTAEHRNLDADQY